MGFKKLFFLIFLLCLIGTVSADTQISKEKYTVTIPTVSDQTYRFESDDEDFVWTLKGMSTRNADFGVLVNYKNNKATYAIGSHDNGFQGIEADISYKIKPNSFSKIITLNKADLPSDYVYLTINEVYSTEKDSTNSYIPLTAPIGSTDKIPWTNKNLIKEITARQVFFGDGGTRFISPSAWDDNYFSIKGYYEVKYNSPGNIEIYTVFKKEDIDKLSGRIHIDPGIGIWDSEPAYMYSWDTPDRPISITSNSSFVWAVGENGPVWKYTPTGTYISTWVISGSGNGYPTGIAKNSSFFWITDSVDAEVYKYYINETYTGTSWDTAATGNTYPAGITIKDNYLWIVDSVDNGVYQYQMDGTYISFWDTSATASNWPSGITNDSSYFWIAESDGEVHGYYQNHTHFGSWDGSVVGLGNWYGIAANDTLFWLSDYSGDAVHVYRRENKPTTTSLYTEHQINGTQIHTNVSAPYFNWTYSDSEGDTQYSWEIQVGTASGLSDMWASGMLLGADTSDIYAGATLNRNTTYYAQVRTNDSYENSLWETGTFKINALPVITNVTVSPIPATDIDDLTANNDTATDGNGDSVTPYYRWYKDDVLQTTLNDIKTILASNLTNGDVWKVGIIPNDGYENGTVVYSATTTIGSSNVAPTMTGIQSNLTTRKYNQSVTITTLNAYDQNDDNYTLHVGTATGLSDICNSSNTANGTEATCDFLIPWTSGSHMIYGRLTDANDTSIEYQEIITVDTTPPSIDSSSVTPSSGTTDNTYQLSASVSIANGSISSVNVCIGQNGYSCINYSMTLSGANYIYNFSTGSAGSYTTTIYASDDSGNVNSATGPSFSVSTGSAGGGGGGGINVTINETIIGDLTITPPRLDTYFILIGETGESSYRFFANRQIVSCVADVGICEISDDRMDIRVTYNINKSMKYIMDNITIKDENGYVAKSKVQYIRVINLASSIPIGEIPVGESTGSFLSLFFEVIDGVIVGIKTWVLLSLVGALGYFVYKGYR